MIFRFGSIPVDEKFDPEVGGWNKCKEPKAWVSTWLISTPLSIVLACVFGVFVISCTHIRFEVIMPLKFLFLYIMLIVIHELIHAFMHPDRGRSSKTIVGFWFSHCTFYAHYEGERSRKNFLIGLISPFIVLSIIPLLLAIEYEISSWWVGALIILNALSSSADLFGFLCILFGVPKGSEVKNRGWYTYWRVLT